MTVATSPPNLSPPEARSVRLYGTLLALYPRPFRDRFGDDMRQAFADLLVHHAGGRPVRVWPRVVLDLVTSASRERAGQLGGGGGRRAVAFVAAATLVTLAVTGGDGSSMLVPLFLLIVLPALGLPSCEVPGWCVEPPASSRCGGSWPARRPSCRRSCG